MDRRVKFYEKGHGHATFFTEDGIYLCLMKDNEKPKDKKGIRAKSPDAFAGKGVAPQHHGADTEKSFADCLSISTVPSAKEDK